MTLQPSELIALLHVLSILHISICLQTCWFIGNVEILAQPDFGAMDKGLVADLCDDEVENIADNGDLMLQEDFMMKITGIPVSGSVAVEDK